MPSDEREFRMSDLFDSPRLKLSGANEEMGKLREQIVQFFIKSNPYKPSVYPDADSAGDIHALRLVRSTEINKVLDKMGLLCARIASEMRDALDQAGYASALAEGTRAVLKKTYFPICKDESQFDQCVRQNTKHLPPDIVTLFRSYKAHPGGDKLLVALNNLAGGGKHCIIDPVAQGIGNAFYKTISIDDPSAIRPLSGKWDSTHDEIPMFWVKRGAKVKYEMNASFFIAFSKIDLPGAAHYPVLSIFEAMARKVESIVTATEAECRRIGLIV
jgi:hypothetical protein